jgi:hypothetical protein
LPQAVEAGATIEADTEAIAVSTLCDVRRTPDEGAVAAIPYRYEVQCKRKAGRRESIRYRAKLLILGGGAVGTARLLLNSKEHLPLLSDQLGRNISFNGSVKTAGILPESYPDGDMYTGRSHPGIVSYEFLESHGIMVTAGKPLPLQAVASARLKLDGDERMPVHWGAPHVALMKQYRKRMIVLAAFGMTPPLGKLTLAGPNKFELSLPITDGLRHYYRETKALLHAIMQRNGCRLVDAEFVNHEGAPHRHGVVNAASEVFGYPGMYVSDGAAIPTSLAVNTSLTILANAERIAEGIRARYQMGRPAVAVVRERPAAH